ncbi:hypothetical protein DRN86_03030 [Candidatus Geothermarchaeota archaeon]|nr:MAG: hypothetical protein DRN86_03030 [Candidatus Geothermarchaeota archaeon]
MEENPLLTLPRPIIEALFKCADYEAIRAKKKILKLENKLKQLGQKLRFQKIKGNRGGVISAVDGSMSPRSSSRIGCDFGIYTAGYMVFEGRDLKDEKYYAGSLSWNEGRLSFKTLLRLLMAYAERKAALETYWSHNPDFIILDGPFFYFRGFCRYVKAVRIGIGRIKTGLDLIKRTRDMTLLLMKTKKAVCVIRRSVIRAIDGWILYNYGEDYCFRTRDKHILTTLMPPNSIWDYSDLFGDEHNPLLYATFYRFYRKWRQAGESAENLSRRKEELMEQSIRDWEKKFKKDLNLELSELPRLKRYYIRYSSSAPPFEVEVVEGTDVEAFAEHFVDFHNPTTGLPLPMDLIDSAVRLPRGATTAFTEEIEARLVRDPDIKNKTAISDYFTYLNPQKREFV